MATSDNFDAPWLIALLEHVEKKPCVVLRLGERDSEQLAGAYAGFNEFTLARSHDLLSEIRPPTVCLIINSKPAWVSHTGETPHAHIGIVSSRGPITTLETRIKVKRAVCITPATQDELVDLLATSQHATQLRRRLETSDPIVALPPKLSRSLIEALASIQANRLALQSVSESLQAPRRFSSMAALQEDAVQTALKAFGLGSGDRADRVELTESKLTALLRIPLPDDNFTNRTGDAPLPLGTIRTPLLEDSAIEHDARSVPGYTLTSSDLTGRAVFQKGAETLQVITANRRELEHVFGVDLIYLNLTKRNIVMVQYKMLEANRASGQPTDWIYRPDQQLTDQIAKMKLFARQHAPGQREYRLNPEAFYLKFVKRDGTLTNGGIITPLEHFELLLSDPASKGERGGIRVSYEALNGRYMRRGAFVDLIRSGYLGAYMATTDHLAALIQSVLDGDRAVVAAVQTSTRFSAE